MNYVLQSAWSVLLLDRAMDGRSVFASLAGPDIHVPNAGSIGRNGNHVAARDVQTLETRARDTRTRDNDARETRTRDDRPREIEVRNTISRDNRVGHNGASETRKRDANLSDANLRDANARGRSGDASGERRYPDYCRTMLIKGKRLSLNVAMRTFRRTYIIENKNIFRFFEK